MYQSESIGKLSLALSKAQGRMSAAKKDSVNPHFRSQYADLTSVWEACREELSAENLSVVQTLQKHDDEQYLVTSLIHESGEWIKSYVPLFLSFDGKNINLQLQQLGTCLTYLRRYSLSAMIGIVSDVDIDDDGNKANSSYSISAKKEEKKEDTITKDQIELLESFLKDDVNFKNVIESVIKGSFKMMPKSRFEGALATARKRKEEREKELIENEGEKNDDIS